MDRYSEPKQHLDADWPTVHVLKGDERSGLLLLADHAMPHLPPGYGSLGLAPAQFERHIAYDIGIEGLARKLNAKLSLPTIMAGFSRLLIDPNRGEDDPTLIMQLSDGAVVPGNANISPEEVMHRKAHFYRPYHQAITSMIDRFLAQGITPILLSLHSFTHNWRGDIRPWHAGVLWDRDDRFVHPLLDALRADTALVVGDNKPYTGQLKGDCMYRHGTSRGLAHALLEVRQDLIDSEEGQEAWASRLAGILSGLLADEALLARCREVEYFGSYSDPDFSHGYSKR